MHIGTSKHVDFYEPSPFKMSFAKAMMWIFVIGDVFLFSGFIISMGLARFSEVSWPDTHPIFSSFPFLEGLHLPLVLSSVMTFLLMISSLTMLFATQSAWRKDAKEVAKWLLVTNILGAVFLLCQVWEWTHLYHEGAWWGSNPFSNADGTLTSTVFTDYFFTITGFHGVHVVLGLLLNTIAYVKTVNGSFAKVNNFGYVDNVGIFWHFVDFVWVFVFTCYYLL